MSSVYRTILKRRTIRRFKQKKISRRILKKLVNAGRFAPSAANLQPLEYLIIDDKDKCRNIFPYLNWANYISPYGTPPPEKSPVAYIVILRNKNRETPQYSPYDVGASAENIILCAWELGLGVCWIKSFAKDKISQLLDIPSYLDLDSILALGYRAEMPRVEVFEGSVKYWLDRRGVLHVPKRKLSDVLHLNKIESKYGAGNF